MSRIIEKLKQVRLARASHKDSSAPTAHQDDYSNDTPSGLGDRWITAPRILVTVLIGWALTLILAISLMIAGGSNRRAFIDELARMTRIQNDKISSLENSLSELGNRHKKYAQSVDEKFNTANYRFIKSDKQIQEIATSFDTLNRDLRSLQVTSRNILDKYSDLSSELKTLKLLTTKESVAIIETGKGDRWVK